MPEACQELLQIDSALAVAQEKIQLAESGAQPLTATESEQADSAKELIKEFQTQCQNSNLFDFSKHHQSITQFLAEFKLKLNQSLDIYKSGDQ